jgi:hypothetical protein
MSDTVLEELREKARAKMANGKLPKTTKDVERIVADVHIRPSGVCAVCDCKQRILLSGSPLRHHADSYPSSDALALPRGLAA